jgi:hypothetical protein
MNLGVGEATVFFPEGVQPALDPGRSRASVCSAERYAGMFWAKRS